MDILTSLAQGLVDMLVLLANGFLLVLYALAGQLPLLLSLGCALLVALVFDPQTQDWSQFMPGRDLRPATEPSQPRRQQQVLTGAAALAWIVASSLFPSPVPWLGLLMWLTTVAGLLLLPAERVSLLWRGKTFVAVYSLALLGFRGYLALLGAASPEAWAVVMGSSAEAQRVLASNRGLLTTIGFWVTCFALPAAQVVYLVQRLTTHPLSLLGPRMRPADIVRAIRTRSQDQ